MHRAVQRRSPVFRWWSWSIPATLGRPSVPLTLRWRRAWGALREQRTYGQECNQQATGAEVDQREASHWILASVPETTTRASSPANNFDNESIAAGTVREVS
jgi:hypothetical protein